ncbi:MAG: siderophore-interacting protein [Pigmentiphaga sp.]
MHALVTKTSLSVDDAEDRLREVMAHLAEHDFQVDEKQGVWRLTYQTGQGVLWVEQSTIHAEARADGMELLHDLKMMIAGHLIEFCDPDRAPLVWLGDGAGLARPPAFRVLTVQEVHELGPHFRRIRFGSQDLQRYGQEDNLHCKLMFPQPGVSEPEWPTLNESGLPRLPQGEKRLDLRTYTIRRIDAAQQWLDIDFVLHDDAGPGSRWAAQARRGQLIGMTGPGGRTASLADRMVLAGDETAVPAMARIAEALPDNTACRVLAEVAGPDDELDLSLPVGVQWTWLHRGACAAGESSLLRERFEALDWESVLGQSGESRFVWLGAEFATVQHLRNWARETLKLEKREQLMVAYWRNGLSEHEFKQRA